MSSIVETHCHHGASGTKIPKLSSLNPIQAGLFWNHIGGGKQIEEKQKGGAQCVHIVAPPSVSPLFVVQLPLNLAC